MWACGLSEGSSGGGVKKILNLKEDRQRIFLEGSCFNLPGSEVEEKVFLLSNEKNHTSLFRKTNFIPVVNL